IHRADIEIIAQLKPVFRRDRTRVEHLRHPVDSEDYLFLAIENCPVRSRVSFVSRQISRVRVEYSPREAVHRLSADHSRPVHRYCELAPGITKGSDTIGS